MCHSLFNTKLVYEDNVDGQTKSIVAIREYINILQTIFCQNNFK